MTSFLAAAAGAAALACSGPRTLTPTFGRANGAWLFWQRANPSAAARPAVTGLDSEEAKIIADSYRRSLASKEAREEYAPQVLILPEQKPGMPHPAQPLAPSVPKP